MARKEVVPVTEQHFGMVQYVINLDTPETFTDGVLDALAQIYWMFDDESGLHLSVDLRYHVQGVARTKLYPMYTWEDGLKGLKKYLSTVRKGIFARTLRHKLDDLSIELRIPQAGFITAIPTMTFIYDKLAEANGECAEAGEFMSVKYPEHYKEFLEEISELNA